MVTDKRKRLIKRVVVWSAAVVATFSALLGAVVWRTYTNAVRSNVGELSFDNALKIPPLLEPTVDNDGRKVFDLQFQEGVTELVDGKDTPTWGLNGSYLGPTLRASRGDDVRVNVTNDLDERTTLHWHGMKLPARADGGPHQMIEPGDTWSPEWTIDQPASTLWFHPHLHGATAEHVYRGAAGMFIIDDPEARALGLPDTYGVDDIPVIVQDKRFNGDGTLDTSAPFLSQLGVLGKDIVVNGTHDPHLEVTTTRVRLRLLNASNARIYNFGFTDERSFHLIATDSGLLDQPVELDRIQLSPGERAEIVVEVSPGDRTVLRSYKPKLGTGGWNKRFSGGDDTFDILQLRAADRLEPSAELPARLVDIERPDASDAVRTRTFDLQGREINGRRMDMARVDQVVEAGATEIWEVTNRHGVPHSFHPHLVHFAIVDIDGKAPPAHLAGWKDTIYVPPHATYRLIARFDGEPDAEVPYMFHCHILAHEDDGMMGQFILAEPGDRSVGEGARLRGSGDMQHDH